MCAARAGKARQLSPSAEIFVSQQHTERRVRRKPLALGQAVEGRRLGRHIAVHRGATAAARLEQRVEEALERTLPAGGHGVIDVAEPELPLAPSGFFALLAVFQLVPMVWQMYQ